MIVAPVPDPEVPVDNPACETYPVPVLMIEKVATGPVEELMEVT